MSATATTMNDDRFRKQQTMQTKAKEFVVVVVVGGWVGGGLLVVVAGTQFDNKSNGTDVF